MFDKGKFSEEDKWLIFKDMESDKAYIKLSNKPKLEDDEIKKGWRACWNQSLNQMMNLDIVSL